MSDFMFIIIGVAILFAIIELGIRSYKNIINCVNSEPEPEPEPTMGWGWSSASFSGCEHLWACGDAPKYRHYTIPLKRVDFRLYVNNVWVSTHKTKEEAMAEANRIERGGGDE